MTYSTGPYRLFTSLPVPARPKGHSARKIDVPTKAYVFDATTGGYEGMPVVAQRVVLLVSYAIKQPEFVTPQAMSSVSKAIRDVLAPLVKDGSITLRNVRVYSDARGSMRYDIDYYDLTQGGLDQTVQL
jgi:hypothetical protein